MENKRVLVLDGDRLRKTISSDLGFSKKDREVHNRRVICLAEKYVLQGYIVIVALISPYSKIRREARERLNTFIEVYLRCPLEVCKQRDTRHVYERFARGEISQIAGIDMPYEEPVQPDLILDTDKLSIDQCMQRLIEKLSEI